MISSEGEIQNSDEEIQKETLMVVATKNVDLSSKLVVN